LSSSSSGSAYLLSLPVKYASYPVKSISPCPL